MGYTLSKFRKFEEISFKAMELMRQNSSFSPGKKPTKTWTLTDASAIVGRAINTIKEHEKKRTYS